MTSFSATTNDTDPNKIATQLKLLVRTLQYFGGYPIKIKIVQSFKENKIKSTDIRNICQKQNKKIENVFETTIFKWTEVGFWYSYILHALKTFSALTFICNIGFGIPYPVQLFSYKPEVQQGFTTKESSYTGLGFAATAFLNILKTIFIVWNTPDFVRWLNNWSVFQRDFLNCFSANNVKNKQSTPLTMEMDIRPFLNRALFCLVVLSLLWTPLTVNYMLSTYIFYVELVSIACLVVGEIGASIHPLMEDIKILIMLKTQVLAFEQILAGIKEIGIGQSSRFMISAKDVIGWRGLVSQARAQTAIVSEYLKSQEMLTVADTILSCSAGVIHVFRTINGANVMTVSLVMTVFGSLFYYCIKIFRLYLKVLLAEKISAGELLVADEVFRIDASTEDGATKAELKFIYSQIRENTVTVNFGNYFELDKKLLLSVGAQVVTYLIVILQFQSSK